jgi:hypothetical protein
VGGIQRRRRKVIDELLEGDKKRNQGKTIVRDIEKI